MEFIYECEDVFPESFCKQVIEKFERSNLKFEGVVGGENLRKENNIKKSTDLRIFDEPEWIEEEKYFHDVLKKTIKNYENFLLKMDVDDKVKNQLSCMILNTHVCSPQIQRTDPGQFYHWHQDDLFPQHWGLLTYIVYLNDVEKDSGGTTEFICGKNIQPKTGKVILFPSTWTYFHRGKTLEKGVKYIATNFMATHPHKTFSVSRRQLEQQNKTVLPFIISSK
tara:strand:+ start:94 stop:762 length:669 start_codon:yes stop_codon:yes gene_type:complete